MQIPRVISLTGLAVAVAALATGTAASAKTKIIICPVFIAAQGQLPFSPYTKSERYQVHNNGTKYSCRELDHYASVIIGKRGPKGPGQKISGGPSGWVCTASAGKNSHPFQGECAPNTTDAITGPGFSFTMVI